MSPSIDASSFTPPGNETGCLGDPLLHGRARTALDQIRGELLGKRNADGHWVGRLSPSALSTATAVSALSAMLVNCRSNQADRSQLTACIERGIHYLRCQQNEDGGFGDTDRSHSNIATSYLALAASALAGQAIGQGLAADQVDALQCYLTSAGEIDGLRRRYGTDKTFVVPILTNLAIAGIVSWDDVPALPFEAAVFPQSMYRWLQMPVVSYAVPALVAIGQARHFRGSKAIWPIRWVRSACVSPALKVLRRMQPESGGYLEATPLTAFVLMSLAATGRGDHPVGQHAVRFLVDAMLDDGSWPIDTNLATWVSSLSIHALSCDPHDDGSWCDPSLVRWHLGCQHLQRHPFTGAEPGGWGWTDLSGAVPDSDDTPAAIIATVYMSQQVTGELRDRCQRAIAVGCDWLRRLQNRDGGWPTFCRGWGKLPFDRSSNDLTAHVIRAFDAATSGRRSNQDQRSVDRGIDFIERHQLADGSWLPLWFGNQDLPGEINPVYGTSRVLVAAAASGLNAGAVARGVQFLIDAQNSDGGWGGGSSLTRWLDSVGMDAGKPTSSVEETALAVDGLVTIWNSQRNPAVERGVQSDCSELKNVKNRLETAVAGPTGGTDPLARAIIRGVEFLIASIGRGRHQVAWPIGFYFAKLWYHEELYPLIFANTALGKYLQAVPATDGSDSA